MRKLLITITLLIFTLVNLIPYSPANAEAKPTLAILDMEASEGVTDKEARLITELLRDNITNSGFYTVMAQDQMRKVIETQGFNQSGFCSTTECEIKLGQLLQVQSIMAGTVGKLGNTFILAVRMIDVEKGNVILSRTERTKSADDLADAVDKLSKHFTGGMVTTTTGNIEIKSNPDNAEMFINNQLQGKTPNTIKDLDPGLYNLTVKKSGYKDVTKNFTIQAGKIITENIIMDKIEFKKITGILEIKSDPQDAKVFINGVEKGVTPLKMEDIETGTYRITLTKEGYKESKKDTVVKFNTTTTENMNLEKIESNSGGGEDTNWILWVVLGGILIGGIGAAIALSGGNSSSPTPAGKQVDVSWE